MAQVTETFEQEKFRRGKSFFFLHSELALAAAATDNFVICVGNKAVTLKGISVEGSGEIMSWQAFAGTQITEGTGTNLKEIPRNSTVASESGIEIELNPTVNADGLPFFDNPVDLVAQVAAGNRAYLHEDLLSDLFALQANTCYLIELTNDDVSAVKYEMNFQVFTE